MQIFIEFGLIKIRSIIESGNLTIPLMLLKLMKFTEI